MLQVVDTSAHDLPDEYQIDERRTTVNRIWNSQTCGKPIMPSVP